jgi:hypothetical protein
MFARRGALAIAVLVGILGPAASGCTQNKSPPKPTEATATPSASSAAPLTTDAAVAAVEDSGSVPEAPLVGADFAAQAKALARVVACSGGDDALPSRFDAKVVGDHCKEMATLIAEYKKGWVDVAEPFIAKLIPKGVPDKVVYPFGGGDLLTALATYQDAVEYTTVSLEHAADVRKVDQFQAYKLKGELGRYRSHLAKLFEKAHSRTDNLDIGSKSDLPGQIVFSLVAAEVHGWEPTSLRYFHFKPDGVIEYLEMADINAQVAKAKAQGKDPDEVVFGNMELRFKKKGGVGGKPMVLRHVVFNLDDWHMKADPSLLKHLEAKGKCSMMTKAATHLLWLDAFSIIRDYVLGHTDFMISDSTGVPPRLAKAAGFVQDTYGTFVGPSEFGAPNKKDADELVKLFKTNPHVDVPFRYGYPDADHHGHIVVTRKP